MHAVPEFGLNERRPDEGWLHTRASRTLLALAVLAAASVAIAVVLGAGSPAFLVVEAVAVAVAVAGYRLLTPRRDRLERVIDGLAADGWHVINDVYTGLHSIDHILVGPAGIFTVSAAYWRGLERAIETDRFLLSQTYGLSRWTECAAATPVEALLVFPRAFVFPAVSRQCGVWVMSTRGLRRHLGRLEAQLSAQEVHATFDRLVHGMAVQGAASSRASASATSTARAMVA